jgi:hypothetical protein
MNKRLSLDNKIKLNISSWDFYGLVLLLCAVLLLVPTWPKLPYFMDCYYHLSVMRGFADAGGWVPEAFWEFAPVGRPQLYPPLVHFLELAAFRAGLSPLTIAKLFDFFIYPVFLSGIWWPLRWLAGKRLAFFMLLLMVSSASLYLAVLNNIPFSLALVFSFMAYGFLRSGRTLGAAAALILSFTTHTLMSFIGAAAFLGVFLFLRQQERRRAFAALAGALAAAAPLFVFQAAHVRFFNFGKAMEFYFTEINLVLYALFLLGLVFFFRQKKQDCYFAVLLASMSVLFFTHRDRFLGGIGLVPISFFAATALDGIWCRIRSRGIQARHGLFWGFFIALLFVTTPIVRFSPPEAKMRFEWESSLLSMAGLKSNNNVKSQTLYHPRLYPEIIRFLERRSTPEDIIFSNIEYGGGIIAVLAHRATSFAMLREIRPNASFDPVAVARFIIWFKNPEGVDSPFLKEVALRYDLHKAGETELVYLYENRFPATKRRVVRALVPESVCFGLIGFLIILILVDLRLNQKEEKKVDIEGLM